MPVVLLHGTGGVGLAWAPYAAGRGDRAVYAVDTIGDVGRSRSRCPVTGPDDLAEWLDQTLAGLGLDRVHLCGTSYGGFLALNLAARRPERVCSLFLIEPAGIAPVRILRFMVWGLSSMVASLLPGFLRRPAARRLRMPALEDQRLIRLAFYAARHHRTRLLRPEPLSDDLLDSIDRPVTMILGAKSEVMRTEQVRARAEQHLRRLSVEVVPDAGHAVQLSAAGSHRRPAVDLRLGPRQRRTGPRGNRPRHLTTRCRHRADRLPH